MSKLETAIEEKENKVDENKNKTEDKNEVILFSELMDKIYPKKFNNNTKSYTPNRVSEVETRGITEVNNNNIEIKMYGVYANQENNGIDLEIKDTSNNIDKNYVIYGVDEEVVSIVVVPFEAEVMPNYIYFLTRKGNVYYLYNNNIDDITNLKATKIENINNVISITSTSVIEESDMHSYIEVIASTYEGDYKELTNYINK